jgi:hypothetical protein
VPFLYKERGTPAEYGAGMKLAIERGWLWMHERHLRDDHQHRRRAARLNLQLGRPTALLAQIRQGSRGSGLNSAASITIAFGAVRVDTLEASAPKCF